METKDFIKKAKEKALYKYRGKVVDISRVTENIVHCIMFKTAKIAGKTEKVIICFICYGSIAEFFYRNYKKNDRLKIRFRVKSHLYENRYYTNCIVVEHEKWPLNEDKLLKEARIKKMNERQLELGAGKQTGIEKNEPEWL